MAKKKSKTNVKAIKKEIKVEDMDIKPECSDDDGNTDSPVKAEMKNEASTDKKNWRYFSSRKSGGEEKSPRGVVYVGSLPHGFYENQLEGYFGQFGKVTGVYVPKSKKTGKPKGYAFVQFLHPEVAEIAAETMNNYLMFNRLIKTKIIPPEKQRSYMFKEKFKMRTHRLSRNKTGKVVKKTKISLAKNRDSYISKSMKKLNKMQDTMKNLGIDYKVKVAGLHEGVTLTSIKTIDPDTKGVQIKKEESNTSKTKKGKVAPSPSESMVEESSEGATIPATGQTAVVKKAVVKQLTAAKNKAVKITKAKGKSNTATATKDGQKGLKKSAKTNQKSLTVDKSKETKGKQPALSDQSQPTVTKADGVKKMVKTAQQKLTIDKSKKTKGKPTTTTSLVVASQSTSGKVDGVKKMVKTAQQKLTIGKSKKTKGKPTTTTSLVVASQSTSGKVDVVKKIAKTIVEEQLSSVKGKASQLSKAIAKTKKKIQNKKGTKKTKNNSAEDDTTTSSSPHNTQSKTPIVLLKSKKTKKSPPSDKLRKTKKMASPLKKKSNKAKLETTV